MSRAGLEDFAEILMSELKTYTETKSEKINKAAKKVSRKALKAVRSKSPELTGDYRKGWKVKILRDSPTTIAIVVHQRGKEHKLTHLLEYGHKSKSGKKVDAIPHIEQVQEEANIEISQEINKILSEE